MSQCITRDGIGYRTRTMTLDQAARFARCLQGNVARFTGVELEESKRAKGERRWIVRYQPVSVERVAAIIERQQASRSERAEAQQGSYEVVQEPHGRFFYVHNLESGDVYETTARTCDCPDFQYRCRCIPGMTCKHSDIVRLKLAQGEDRTW